MDRSDDIIYAFPRQDTRIVQQLGLLGMLGDALKSVALVYHFLHLQRAYPHLQTLQLDQTGQEVAPPPCLHCSAPLPLPLTSGG